MMNMAFMNKLRFTQGKPYTIQGTTDTCTVITTDRKSFTAWHCQIDRDISATVVADPDGNLFIADKCQLQHTKHFTGSIHQAVLATASRFDTSTRDGNGRPSGTPEIYLENMPIHFLPKSSMTYETTPDRNADITQRKAITLSSFNVVAADLLTIAGDTYKVLGVYHTEYGVDELALVTM